MPRYNQETTCSSSSDLTLDSNWTRAFLSSYDASTPPGTQAVTTAPPCSCDLQHWLTARWCVNRRNRYEMMRPVISLKTKSQALETLIKTRCQTAIRLCWLLLGDQNVLDAITMQRAFVLRALPIALSFLVPLKKRAGSSQRWERFGLEKARLPPHTCHYQHL